MSDWENQETLAGQTSITYDETGKTYDEATYQYNGKVGPIWAEQTKN